jgi:ABC-type enterochelin transport system ATPase subunit
VYYLANFFDYLSFTVAMSLYYAEISDKHQGLDASSALLVMKSLNHLVEKDGVTVVSVIHQVSAHSLAKEAVCIFAGNYYFSTLY